MSGHLTPGRHDAVAVGGPPESAGASTSRGADGDAPHPLARLASLDAPLPWQLDDRAPTGRLKTNSHVHVPPNFSAFRDVTEAVELAAASGVRVLGASNYYDYEIYRLLGERAAAAGVFPLYGLEAMCGHENLRQAGIKINDPGNPGKMYLCGKGLGRLAPMSERAAELLEGIRRTDDARIHLLVDSLAGVFAGAGFEVEVSVPSIVGTVAGRCGAPEGTVHLQERHVAQAFQEALFQRVGEADRPAALERLLGVAPGPGLDPVAVQNALRTHLMKAGKPAYVPEHFVGFDHVFEMVLELGGIPCYPVLADGARPICAFEDPVDRLVEYLLQHRIRCAELIPNRNDPAVLEAYVLRLRAAGIVVVAGTEHNTLDMVGMEPVCGDGSPIPDPVQDVFWEGVCVVAAHQFCVARGEAGYVDGAGELNPAFTTVESRIRAYARAGAAVIDTYLRDRSGVSANQG